MKQINMSDIEDISSGAIMCDGSVNACIYLRNGSYIELFGLSLKQADQLELSFKNKTVESFNVDSRLLEQSDSQWLKQNGVIS